MMKNIVTALLFLTFSLGAMAQGMVRGIVFEDLNGNGIKDRREKGVDKVSVSNGMQVVQSDSQGKYELPISDDQIIFVIKPSNYQVATDLKNLPQFFYNHKPHGSPEFNFLGVKPTGQLPKSVDFALLPGQHKEKFTSLVFGDPQP